MRSRPRWIGRASLRPVRISVELRIVEDPEAAARAAAEELARAAEAGEQVALAGGSTPRRAYELAAELESDWSRAALWWGDERCVRPDDPRSNFRLVREALLDRIETPPAAVHRIQGELEPTAAAAAYDRELEAARLDVALLGLGPDGHTASLFPNAPTLTERKRRAVAAEAGLDPWVPRVTMTVPELCSAMLVLFLVTGAEKAEAAARAFAQPPTPATPASMIRSASGVTVAILDRSAAHKLPE
jgi:6-phosphogluconolactonase